LSKNPGVSKYKKNRAFPSKELLRTPPAHCGRNFDEKRYLVNEVGSWIRSFSIGFSGADIRDNCLLHVWL
jgi:hypothetical protein